MATRRRSPIRPRRRVADPDATSPTYSIWWPVAVFVLLTAAGLVLFVKHGATERQTERLMAPQTLPPNATTPDGEASGGSASGGSASGEASEETGGEEEGTSSDGSDNTPSDGRPDGQISPRPTFPGGAPAPDEVAQVAVEDGTTSVAFDPPPGRPALPTPGPGAPDAPSGLEGFTIRVPPTSATPNRDGTALEIRTRCAASADEYPAQITVAETDDAVTVTAAVLVPDDGPPCTGGIGTTLTVPLSAPLGARTLAVTPAGTRLENLPGS